MALSQENINRIGQWVSNEILMPHLAPCGVGRQNVFQRKFIKDGKS